MKSMSRSRALFAVGVLVSLNAVAAENTVSTAAAAKDVARSSSAVVVAKPAAAGKPVAKAGAMLGNAGDNQFPSGAPIVPPKPKKELLEGAAIKANVAKP
jgi:hypothetical protein